MMATMTETCARCNRALYADEPAMIFGDRVVCPQCHAELSPTSDALADLATAVRPFRGRLTPIPAAPSFLGDLASLMAFCFGWLAFLGGIFLAARGAMLLGEATSIPDQMASGMATIAGWIVIGYGAGLLITAATLWLLRAIYQTVRRR